MKKFLNIVGKFGIVISLVVSIVWHLYTSYIIYQIYGGIWMLISFIFPVISETVLIILLILRFGFFDSYVIFSISVFLLAMSSIYLEQSFNDESTLEDDGENRYLVKCDFCKKKNELHSKYCSNCGREIKNKLIKQIDRTKKSDLFVKCDNCDANNDIDSKYCSMCGNYLQTHSKSIKNPDATNVENLSSFGRGRKLKYFNLLYNLIPIVAIPLLIINLSDYFQMILNVYNGSLLKYLSEPINLYSTIFFFGNLALTIALIISRIKKLKDTFSRLMIYRLIGNILDPLLTALFLMLGTYSLNIESTFVYFLSSLLISGTTMFYLSKRIIYKISDFSSLFRD